MKTNNTYQDIEDAFDDLELKLFRMDPDDPDYYEVEEKVNKLWFKLEKMKDHYSDVSYNF